MNRTPIIQTPTSVIFSVTSNLTQTCLMVQKHNFYNKTPTGYWFTRTLTIPASCSPVWKKEFLAGLWDLHAIFL